ncbi:MAG: D-aminoacyl-tRNA deacylase, partial [Burkholderiales bacterium]|nr:D-aminoacyl-tRNA deacylase [Burkholderiales bacterium]
MIALVQRVARAEVQVGGVTIGAIAQGLAVLVCAEPQDTERLADQLVAKLLKLRIFADAAGKMNLSLADV